MSTIADRDQPGKLASGVMAVAVHVAFFMLLVFGVSWQRRAPDTVMVDLWNSLPPIPAVKTPPPPPPAPRIETKPPPPVKAEPKPQPKPAPEPKPVAKPDIALEKEKQDKARREQAERERLELKKREDQAKADQRKRDEQAKVEQKKREDTERQQLAALEKERAAKEAERARLEKEQQEAIERLQQQQAAALNKQVDEYRSRISEKIRRYVNKEPCASLGSTEIVFEAILLPDGNVLPPPRIRRSSGNAACDDAVMRAVMRAQPLPLPRDPALFARFRELNLQFRPNE
ncbi:MAG: TonB C-terminal domain-containing protein [Burkholderiales bacterium]|nr:TonB C-terminal domain-containing protein [Burkholderiales bacterium]